MVAYTPVCRGFKGLKQAIKLEFKLGRYDKVGGRAVVASVADSSL